MKAKFFFITIFATANAFLGGFAVGFNSRHALIGDPNIPEPKIEKVAPASTPKNKDSSDKKGGAKPESKTGDAASKKDSKTDRKNSKEKSNEAKSDKAAKPKKVEKAKASPKDKSSKKNDAKTSKPKPE